MSPQRRKCVLVIPPPVEHMLHLHGAAMSWNSRYISINSCRWLVPCQRLRDTALSNIIPETQRCATGGFTPAKTHHLPTFTPPGPPPQVRSLKQMHVCNSPSCNPNTVFILPRMKGEVNKQMERVNLPKKLLRCQNSSRRTTGSCRCFQKMICVFQSPLPATPPAGPMAWELASFRSECAQTVFASKSKANRRLMLCEGLHKRLPSFPFHRLICFSPAKESVCKMPF